MLHVSCAFLRAVSARAIDWRVMPEPSSILRNSVNYFVRLNTSPIAFVAVTCSVGFVVGATLCDISVFIVDTSSDIFLVLSFGSLARPSLTLFFFLDSPPDGLRAFKSSPSSYPAENGTISK